MKCEIWYRFGAVALFCVCSVFAGEKEAKRSESIIELTGVRTGIVSVLGFTSSQDLLELDREGRKIVHGITSNRSILEKARKSIEASGQYGRVSVQWGDFKSLPYQDNLVNLLFIDDITAVREHGLGLKEMFRVMVPKGTIAFRSRITQASLKEAGFVHIQNRSGLIWAIKPRSEEYDVWSHIAYNPSGNRVSKDKRIEAPNQLKWVTGSTWPTLGLGNLPTSVIAGERHIFYVMSLPPKTFDRRKRGPLALVARDAFNGTLAWQKVLPPRQHIHPTAIVANAEHLYTLVEPGGPLVKLSAKTGRVLFTYKATKYPMIVLYQDDKILSVGSGEMVYLKAKDGEVIWKRKTLLGPAKLNRQGQMFPNTLLSEDRVFYLETKKKKPYALHALDLKTGELLWKKEIDVKSLYLCSHKDGILILGEGNRGKAVHAYRVKDGSRMWSHEFPPPKHGGKHSDGFFLNGYYWCHVGDVDLMKKQTWKTQATGWRALDPKSGKIVKSFNYSKETSIIHRCHLDKATERFIIGGSTDFVDLESEKSTAVRFTRGACQIGILPANGLTYSFPFGCICQPFIRGIVGLHGTRQKLEIREPKVEKLSKTVRKIGLKLDVEDWPCYRHDETRSLASRTEVPLDMKPLWRVRVSEGNLTPPVSAFGKVFLSSLDDHKIVAVDQGSGEIVWSFSVDSKVDSPPTLFEGRVLFGSKKGSVYALQADTGKLLWRMQASPGAKLIHSHGQLESVLPVHGSVSIVQGLLLFGAGRHSAVDGGIRLYGVDPLVGEIKWRSRLHTPERSGHLSDIFVAGEKNMFMGSYGFDALTGKHIPKDPEVKNYRFYKHLIAGKAKLPILDRTWVYRGIRRKGFVQGYVLAFDQTGVYGLMNRGRGIGKMSYVHQPGKDHYAIFKAEDDKGKGWEKILPVQAKSLIVANNTIFICGETDVMNPKGAIIMAYDKESGKLLGEWKVDAKPVHDSLAVARGRLFMSTKEGVLYCFGKMDGGDKG